MHGEVSYNLAMEKSLLQIKSVIIYIKKKKELFWMIGLLVFFF